MRYAFLFVLLFAGLTYAAAGDEGAIEAKAPSCSIKTSCNATEACWFSLSNTSDAHVSDCTNDPYSYKLCCSEKYPATIKSACSTDEIDVLTYSTATGDAHVADPFDPYGQHVCILPQTNAVLQCSVKQAAEQAANEECELTLSSSIDAHVSTCSNPYDYGLYCRTNAVSAFAPHVFTTSLIPNTNQHSLYVESSGTVSASAINDSNYSASYAVLYNNRDIYGVASFDSGERDVIKTAKTASTEKISLQQPVQQNRMFLILTRADLDQVQQALNNINSPNDAPGVAIGYATAENMNVQVGIDTNAVVHIQGDEVFLPGTHRLEIKKVDSQNGVQIVSVKRD
jgi:hypothetical protein